MKKNEVFKSVNILGQKYKIKYKDIGQDYYGMIVYKDKQILISINNIDNYKTYKETLIHEMVHGLLFRLHFLISDTLTEIICDCVAKMISENFDLIKIKNVQK